MNLPPNLCGVECNEQAHGDRRVVIALHPQLSEEPQNPCPDRGWANGQLTESRNKYAYGLHVSEHLDVAVIEELLGPSSNFEDVLALPRPLPSAVWICACVALDDAPLWLIVDGVEGVAWCRVPDGVDPVNLVQAAKWCGGHAEPESVLLWLRSEASSPFLGAGGGSGSFEVLEPLRRRLAHNE